MKRKEDKGAENKRKGGEKVEEVRMERGKEESRAGSAERDVKCLKEQQGERGAVIVHKVTPAPTQRGREREREREGARDSVCVCV